MTPPTTTLTPTIESTHVHGTPAVHGHAKRGGVSEFLSTYVFSKDHKVIGLQFLFSTLLWFSHFPNSECRADLLILGFQLLRTTHHAFDEGGSLLSCWPQIHASFSIHWSAKTISGVFKRTITPSIGPLIWRHSQHSTWS